MTSSYVMKVSRNGQMSIPAATRSRWHADRVVVVDLGDRIVVRPLADDPLAELRGAYADRLPDSEAMRASDRAEDRPTQLRR